MPPGTAHPHQIRPLTPEQIANITLFHKEHPWTPWREVMFFLQILVCVAGLICLGCLVKCSEDREKRRRQEAHAKSMLNDTDDVAPTSETEMAELAPAADCATEAVAEGMDGVRTELEKLRLGSYADAFQDNGYDHWPEIRLLPIARFDKLVKSTGMAPNHADRLREQCALQRKVMGLKMAKGVKTSSGMDAVEDTCVIL